MKKITVLGGGTGSSIVLKGLKNFSDLKLNVIVNMTDDGGSNEVITKEFSLLPLSDLRKTILALDPNSENILNKIFSYRFDRGLGLSGHTLGNLVLVALSDLLGSEKKAILELTKLLKINAGVIPVTLQKTKLVAKYSDGSKIIGEHLIDELDKNKKIINLQTIPKVKINLDAKKIILNSNFIIIGPGDLYTTTLANLIISGVREALKKSKAKIIFIGNLTTKKGQTQEMSAKDIVLEIEKYLDRKVDYIVLNNKKIDSKIKKNYFNGEKEIANDFKNDSRIILTDLIDKNIFKKDKGDKLVRSFLRHDSKKLANIIYKIIK